MGLFKALNNVKKGDLFLFFGWFQKTKRIGNDKLQFDKAEYPNGFHAIYGYLKIGKIITEKNKDELKSWMEYHPHAKWWTVKMNTIFVAAKTFKCCGKTRPGGGTFTFRDDLILTKKGETCSRWDLQKYGRDVFKGVNISHNTNTKKYGWKKKKNYFQSAPIGQEFVVKTNSKIKNSKIKNSKIKKWAEKLIKDHHVNK